MKKLLTLSLILCFSFADEFFEPKTSIGGYGEMHWDMTEDSNTNLDFHRFIVYFKHQFSPEWSMMSEVEIEHNMVGSEASLGYGEDNTYNSKYKGGYVAMEQAHLNYWNGNWGFQGGVLLIPSGIMDVKSPTIRPAPTLFSPVESFSVAATAIPAKKPPIGAIGMWK